MPQTIQDLIEQYVSEIKKIYGAHLRQIIRSMQMLKKKEYKSANNCAYYAIFQALNAVHVLDGNAYK